jgi:low affinity Fe/Cu permease
MWKPDERFYVMSHVISSIVTFVSCVCIIIICLVPSFFPGIFRLLVDGRITIVVPYLLFIALAGSIYSIWYFLVRKKK